MKITEFCSKAGINRTNYYKFADEGMPKSPDVEGAREWVRQNKEQRTLGDDAPRPSGGAKIESQDSSDTWEGRLIRARQTERETHKAYMDSLAAGETKSLERLLACHSRSVQAVGEAEEIARKIQKDSGEIATRSDFRAVMATVLTPIRQALDGLPTNEASRCNPSMPDVARKALEEWRDGLLTRITGLAVKL